MAANHNSHLDIAVLFSLLPIRLINKIRPVAAADYFLRQQGGLAWFAKNILQIIPVARDGASSFRGFLEEASATLEQGGIVIVFPEGSRGEPEHISPFKLGIAHLAKKHRDVPVVPIFLHGLGKALPKGEVVFVPFFCDVFVGEPLFWTGSKQDFMQQLYDRFLSLAAEERLPIWE